MGSYLNPGTKGFRESLNSEIYVDKTGLIEKTNMVLDTRQKFLCVSRPRRFGKSMAADMLAAYYERGEDSAPLFDSLKISKSESYQQHRNQYDVIKVNMQEFLSMTQSMDEMLNGRECHTPEPHWSQSFMEKLSVFPILFRRHTDLLFEYFSKVTGAGKTAEAGNINDFFFGILQQKLACMPDSNTGETMNNGLTGIFFEERAEIIFGKIQHISQFIQTDRSGIVILQPGHHRENQRIFLCRGELIGLRHASGKVHEKIVTCTGGQKRGVGRRIFADLQQFLDMGLKNGWVGKMVGTRMGHLKSLQNRRTNRSVKGNDMKRPVIGKGLIGVRLIGINQEALSFGNVIFFLSEQKFSRAFDTRKPLKVGNTMCPANRFLQMIYAEHPKLQGKLLRRFWGMKLIKHVRSSPFEIVLNLNILI